MRTTCSFHQGPFLLTESAAQYLQLKAYQVFFFANGTAFIQKAYLLHLFGNVSVLQAFFFFSVRVSLYSPDCPRISSVDKIGLKLYLSPLCKLLTSAFALLGQPRFFPQAPPFLE